MDLSRQKRFLMQKYPMAAAGGDQPAFVARLFREAEQFEENLKRIMARYEGDPSGIEFRHTTYLRWGIVLPDASEPGRTRIQYFTPSGLGSHRSFPSLEDAVENLVADGYLVAQPGMLDSLAPRWKQTAAEKTETLPPAA